MKHIVAGLCLLLGVTAVGVAFAHRSSDSYLQLSARGAAELDGHWDIALRDLDYALDIDDGDGELSWGELRTREQDARAYAQAALRVEAGATPCVVELSALSIATLSDGSYARFPIRVRCAKPDTLRVLYTLMQGLDPQHRGILKLSAGARSKAAVLVPGAAPHLLVSAFDASEAEPQSGAMAVLSARIAEGFAHILSGMDHVLFLVALLLGTVLVHRVGREQTPTLKSVLLDLTKIVTAFTLAHSITLALAALGLVTVSAAIIEPAIAASVALAALANLFPVLGRDVWVIPFALGLLHGFGFSSGLSDAGLTQGDLWLALLGFNLGVELGQLSIVALFVPLAFAVRFRAVPRKVLLYGGSLATLVLALVWFVERLTLS